MKFLLAAVNAKYIHSNLGVYSLKAYGDRYAGEFLREDGFAGGLWDTEIGEYTINNRTEAVLKDIYRRCPDAVGFSCYIWNISFVMELVRDLPKILPDVEIWLGGPEVSFDAEKILEREMSVSGILLGEGEETFARLMACYAKKEGSWDFAKEVGEIDGMAYRNPGGVITSRPLKKTVDLNRIPFPYENLDGFANRILYYESSRGCPFSCSYCLSSLDKSVRFRDLKLVERELDFFLERGAAQVKFVDRTFNCSREHTLAVWRYLLKHDNGVTNFHFEISADLLDEEELELLSGMRPGLIQLEIGVQSTNPQTIRQIRRKTDLNRLESTVARISSFKNIHQHLDLIAGLPYEDCESFRASFNRVWAMKPEQLQLGFLKVLKGSYMAEEAKDYELRFQAEPPYEVLSTKWLDYGDVLHLKGVEEMVEVYANSGQFSASLKVLLEEFDTAFDLFSELAEYYESQGLMEISHSRIARYEILERFAAEHNRGTKAPVTDLQERRRKLCDAMTYDLYLRENIKSRPAFASDQRPYHGALREFFRREAEKPEYLTDDYEGFEAKQLMHMAHLEIFTGGRAVLFDYMHRDPLTYSASVFEITERLTGEDKKTVQ